MLSGERERKDPGPRHSPTVIPATNLVVELASRRNKAAAYISDSIVDRPHWNVEPGVPRRTQKHDLPTDDRQVGVDALIRIQISPPSTVDVPGPITPLFAQSDR